MPKPKKLKRLFLDTGTECYADLHLKAKCPANVLTKQVRTVCDPIITRWIKKGYSRRDVIDIMTKTIEWSGVMATLTLAPKSSQRNIPRSPRSPRNPPNPNKPHVF